MDFLLISVIPYSHSNAHSEKEAQPRMSSTTMFQSLLLYRLLMSLCSKSFSEESGTSIDACGAADTERMRGFAGMSKTLQLSIQGVST